MAGWEGSAEVSSLCAVWQMCPVPDITFPKSCLINILAPPPTRSPCEEARDAFPREGGVPAPKASPLSFCGWLLSLEETRKALSPIMNSSQLGL